jgi:ribose transport system substrate-binding protein
MIRKTASILSVLLLAACLATFSSCKPKNNDAAAVRVHTVPKGTPLKLAFITNNVNDFWKLAEAGVRKYEADSGDHVDFKMPAKGEVGEQKQILESLLSQGYNGISLSVIAPDAQTGDIDEAARKTNVICHDSDAPNSKRLLFIGTDNRKAGQALGDEIVKLLPHGGKMAVFVGRLSADNAQKRLAGVKDRTEPAHIQIVELKEDFVDKILARKNVEAVITDHTHDNHCDIDVLCGLWAYNGPAMVRAVEGANKKGQIKIVSFDEDEGTLSGIADGYVTCTVVQHPFEFGYQACKWLHDLAYEGESVLPKNPVINIDVRVINKDNLASFRAKLNEEKKYAP